MLCQLFCCCLFVCIASTLMCWACRWNKQQPWSDRSRCDVCSHRLAWWQLIPIVSWLVLLGRCFYCRTAISLQLFCCEVAAALLGWHFLSLHPTLQLAAGIALWNVPLALQDLSTRFVSAPYLYCGLLWWIAFAWVGQLTLSGVLAAGTWLLLLAVFVFTKKLGAGDWWLIAVFAVNYHLMVLALCYGCLLTLLFARRFTRLPLIWGLVYGWWIAIFGQILLH